MSDLSNPPSGPRELSVAVLMGGDSAEAEVSRASASEVGAGLEAKGHQVSYVELDSSVTSALLTLTPEVVFPALHGPPGEDGTVQGFLEMLNLPYVGSDVHGSSLAMDKGLSKTVFRLADLPVADDLLIHPGTDPAAAEASVHKALGERVVIKPLRQGSAIGITLIPNGGELRTAISDALAFGQGVLVEQYVLGKEITVGVLDLHGSDAYALPVTEIRTAPGEWYDYTNRYTPGKSEHVIPAPFEDAFNTRLQEIALIAHQCLGMRDLSRADFIVTDDSQIVLLEVNSLPGMTPTSLYPDGAAAIGMDFATLVDALVKSAFDRASQKVNPG
ncbi:MAG: D-alanine--D-alanine ligase [Gammaproteobacteria bacterium]|nr:D-alanine--D-alanine ligase [Gammaproteobacteria bacterium]